MVTATTAGQDGPGTTRGRKASTFTRMLENLKFGEKKGNPGDDNDNSGRHSDKEVVDEKSKSSQITVKELDPPRSGSTASQQHHLQLVPEGRKLSISMHFAEVFRRPSDTSTHASRNSSPVRGPSASSGRKMSLFRSSNPDDEMDIPCRETSVGSDDGGRQNSWVPRNASSSFLTTVSLKTVDEREPMRNGSLSATGGPPSRQASLAQSELSDPAAASPRFTGQPAAGHTNNGGGGGDRRPSGMVPNNVTARYMRSASQHEDERLAGTAAAVQDASATPPMTASRRRPSARSRQSSNTSDGSVVVKPVTLAPEQYAQWQNSVSKSMARNGSMGSMASGHKPSSDSGRMASVATNGMADVAEEEAAAAAADGQSVAARKQSESVGSARPTGRLFSRTKSGSGQSAATVTGTTLAGTAPPPMRLNVLSFPAPQQQQQQQHQQQRSGGGGAVKGEIRGKRSIGNIDTRKANSESAASWAADGSRMDSARSDLISPMTTSSDGSTIRGPDSAGVAGNDDLEALGFNGAVKV